MYNSNCKVTYWNEFGVDREKAIYTYGFSTAYFDFAELKPEGSDIILEDEDNKEADFSDIRIHVETHSNPRVFGVTKYSIYKNKGLLCEVYRNYYSYPHKIMQHSNGKRYFICGFNYQGYTVVNLDDGLVHHYVHEGTDKGHGWCPTGWETYNKLGNTIRVLGCYWACPEEYRELDMSNPDKLPYPVIREWYDLIGLEDEDDEEESTDIS